MSSQVAFKYSTEKYCAKSRLVTFEKVKIKIGLNALKSLNKSFEFPVEPKFSCQVRAMCKSSKVLDFSNVILNFPGFLYQNQGALDTYLRDLVVTSIENH